MYHVVYFIGRGLCFTIKGISDWFWRLYLLAYCRCKNNITTRNLKTLRFSGKCLLSVSSGSWLHLGQNITVNSGYHTVSPAPSKILVCGGILSIGDHSGLSSSVVVCKEHINIGRYVNIGAGCMILDTNMHSTDWRDRESGEDVQNAKNAPVIINDYVFVGARSIILKGVTIGEKSIISAGSVVVKNIPANCLAGGNPCKVIKYLE